MIGLPFGEKKYDNILSRFHTIPERNGRTDGRTEGWADRFDISISRVMVQLLKQKCLPILLYALDVCNLNKRTMQSLDFTINRFLMKLFKTSNMEIVNYCQTLFGCELPSILLERRFQKFISAL